MHFTIQLLDSKEAEKVSEQFCKSWAENEKGTVPIYNVYLPSPTPVSSKVERAYKRNLSNKTDESYFHGTALKCDILARKEKLLILLSLQFFKSK